VPTSLHAPRPAYWAAQIGNGLLRRRGSRPVALTAVLAILFLTFLDTTIVSVALGSIQNELGAGVIPLQ